MAESRSLQAAENLLEEIQILKDGGHIKCVLAGNKCDVETSERQVVNADAQALATKYGGTFLETSAKKNIGITEAFTEIGRLLTTNETETKKKKAGGGGKCCTVA